MAKLYTVTGWKDTGYDTGNVPGSLDALTGAETVTFNAIFTWQNKDLATIRVESDWDTIQDVDYIRVGNPPDAAYYVVTDTQMAADATAILALTQDPLMTAGGTSAVTVISGQASRVHVSDDTPFTNILPEPWAPSEPLEMDAIQIFNDNAPDSTQEYLNVVMATADLTKMDELAADFAALADDPTVPVVTWPSIPPVSGGMAFRIYGQGDTQNIGYIQIDGFKVYDGSNPEIQKAIAKARSLGIESVITNAYLIPKQTRTPIKWIYDSTGNPAPDGHALGLESAWGTFQASLLPYVYTTAYTPKNKKAISLYNTYQLICGSSGDTMSFEAKDLQLNSASPSPIFRVIVDPSPNGTAYCQPRKFQGREPKLLEYAVAGMPWVNAGIIFSGASGSAVTMANAKRSYDTAEITRSNEIANQNYAQESVTRNTVSTLGNDFLGIVGTTINPDASLLDVGKKAFGTAMDIWATDQAQRELDTRKAYNAAMYERKMGDNLFSAYTATTLKSPELAFPISTNLAAMMGNAFAVTRTRLTAGDLQRFDRFLTAYGYAVDRPLTKEDLTSRKYFNYVKTSGAQVKAKDQPARITKQISAMLDAGVRIWHVLPNPAYMEDNPVKEVNS